MKLSIGLVLLGELDRRSGGYSYDLDMVNALREEGHEVRVLSIAQDAAAASLRLGDLGTTGCDLVIVDGLAHTKLAPQSRLSSGVPVVGLIHHLCALENVEGPTDAEREHERSFLLSCDAFIFNSENTRTTVADFAFGAPIPRPNVVCFPPVRQAPATPRPRERADDVGILFLANILPRKNLQGLIAGLAMAKQQGARFHLDVVGSPDFDPDYAAACRKRAQSLLPGTRFLGRLEGDDLEARWGEADLLAVPSFHEGWGMVYVEAMARGVVPLGNAEGGAAEAIAGAGLLVDAHDPASIASAVLRFCAQDETVRRLSAQARFRAAWLQKVAGFAGLGGFLQDLVGGVASGVQDFDFMAYLASKKDLDGASLHPRILGRCGAARNVVEFGGGNGSMALRLLERGIVDAKATYVLVDEGGAQVAAAREACAGVIEGFRAQQADFYTWISENEFEFDLVVAHAFLDLFHAGTAAAALARLSASAYLLTHIFDGATQWIPVIDPALDATIIETYHRTMRERPGHSLGGDWLEELPRAGLQVVDAASSDWVVVPGSRHGDFLSSMLYFFQSSLSARSDVDPKALEWWLSRRRAQLSRGELGLVVHQLDIFAVSR